MTKMKNTPDFDYVYAIARYDAMLAADDRRGRITGAAWLAIAQRLAASEPALCYPGLQLKLRDRASDALYRAQLRLARERRAAVEEAARYAHEADEVHREAVAENTANARSRVGGRS